MQHDFNTSVHTATGRFEYRTYKNEPEECRGLMDYIDDGVGWSKCSASDFTRLLTNGGKSEPCLPLKRSYSKLYDEDSIAFQYLNFSFWNIFIYVCLLMIGQCKPDFVDSLGDNCKIYVDEK